MFANESDGRVGGQESGRWSRDSPAMKGFTNGFANPLGAVGVFSENHCIHGVHDGFWEKDQDGTGGVFGHRADGGWFMGFGWHGVGYVWCID